MMKSSITTHVLDTSLGAPAAGIEIRLDRLGDDGVWRGVGGGATDADGRAGQLLDGAIEVGTYSLTFETGPYLADSGRDGFFPQVRIEFVVNDAAQHYHVPLLLSPYGYSTYRGT